jgi:hypothetical protein
MAYDHTAFAEGKGAEPGTKLDAEVTLVEEAVLGAFVDAEIGKTWKDFNPAQPAIRITATATDGRKFMQTISLPADPKSVHVKSKMAKWRKAYGEFPHKSQKVYLISNSDGFFRYQC